jgi:hypothetical protein
MDTVGDKYGAKLDIRAAVAGAIISPWLTAASSEEPRPEAPPVGWATASAGLHATLNPHSSTIAVFARARFISPSSVESSLL